MRSCQSLFKSHVNKDAKELEVTFISETEGEAFLKNSIPYFDLASSFLSSDILRCLDLNCRTFLDITEKIYQVLEKDWKYVRNTIRECLYPFDTGVACRLENVSSLSNLKKEMIWIYTCNRVYRKQNAALRRASKSEFPVSDDLLLSLYSLFLTSVLLHWKDLQQIQQTTYRGLVMSANQAKLYTKGTTFYWLPFTSSTRVQEQAIGFMKNQLERGDERALFIIDNSCNSPWRPLDIVPFSANDSNLLEVVHPPCAKFCVTQVKNLTEYTQYNIQLLAPDM